jgi:RNA polymerase sigma-70 factor, ECF subfamily
MHGSTEPVSLPSCKAGDYIGARMNPPRSTPPYPNTSIVDILSRNEKMVTDDELVRRMAEGDEQALGVFYDRWNPMVHAVVLRILRQRDDVEDVVEEAFWQAWRQSNRYDAARGAVQTWLLTIARSRALDRVRSLKRLREEPLEGERGDLVVQLASERDASMGAESAEQRKIVLAALAELPDEQREALELGYYSGLSQSEIADRTGQPLGTIKTRMRLAMQKLKVRLQVLREEAR